MSRIPILLRSSPAQGTGSYGALAISSLGSSTEDSEEDVTARQIAHRSRRAKSALQYSISASKDSFSDPHPADDEDDSIASGSAHRGSRRSRRTGPKSNGSETERHDLDLETTPADPGVESRFNAGSTVPNIEAVPDTRSKHAVVSEDDEVSSQSGHSASGSDSGSDTDEADPPDNSPYHQVRASVKPTDDTTLSINTPRMWFLSILFAILGSSTNLFFSLRYPSVSITPVIALLLVHPLGLLWDQFFKRVGDPDERFSDGTLTGRLDPASRQVHLNGHIQPSLADQDSTWRRSLRLWLGQGRWNEKEHACVYISSNVSFGFAFATDVIVEQTMFYGQKLGITYQILLTISTQVLGYAMAGLTRNYLVRPSGMIWPGTLISASLFSTLHKEENKPANGWTVSRSKFFLYVFIGSVLFYFLPGLLFPALSYFSVVTWFAPKNVVVANFFGIASGLGIFPLTFDWSQIAYIGSPLAVPFWAALNIVAGLIVVMWIVAPILYYSNVMYSSYMPILSTAVFDNTGKPYDVSRILTPDYLFDHEGYNNYSRVFLPITYVLSYALQFAALSALVTHTGLWHGKDIIRQWRRSMREIRSQGKSGYDPLPTTTNDSTSTLRKPTSRRSMNASEPGLDNLLGAEDVHNRLMRRYRDVPLRWYVLTGLSMTAIGMFVVEYFPIHLPWYGLLLALGICSVLFIPIGIVMAITNQQSSLYLICQLICGVVFPGRPVANMVFVTYGYITSTQGLKFSADLKLGHYMKIPPRILFSLQLTATVISSLTQIGVLNWMLANIPGICTAFAINGFTCPLARVHFNGSILWGVVGPQRFFGPGALYRPLVWAFLFGFLSSILVWYLGTRSKKNIWRKINLPVLFGSLSWIPPATGLNFSVWAVVCWIFNDRLMKKKNEWWRKYNMTLSAALDSGLAVGVVVVFFGFLYPGWMDGFKWWGTEVYKQGCDWQACAYKKVPDGGTFGPGLW
ncbi:OPT-domain-containing protein [Pseudovirgaria hyperparasitica]|uniref:OPT-domain-containing protein n=1 Tax=Pseudovirgaria hyperparasitica TaxID=470096 RepID=A0A6A6WGS5_9PEZI|nr:OPT-domain-containing protein [Pseudovirgaria hyperparasitica]KAF2761295.1 OPT-domain-containing protein [Pseudovirgaria hyperparasitica]